MRYHLQQEGESREWFHHFLFVLTGHMQGIWVDIDYIFTSVRVRYKYVITMENSVLFDVAVNIFFLEQIFVIYMFRFSWFYNVILYRVNVLSLNNSNSQIVNIRSTATVSKYFQILFFIKKLLSQNIYFFKKLQTLNFYKNFGSYKFRKSFPML